MQRHSTFIVRMLTAALIFMLPTTASQATQSNISPTVKEPGAKPKPSKKSKDYKEYVAFFEEVYKTVQENYYADAPREKFEKFLVKFDEKIYSQLKGEKKSNDYVRWRSSALLIDALKTPEDIFSGFYPPEPAKEFEQSALGVRVDLGIDGERIPEGFLVKQVEPRSDAYQKGLRNNDLIAKVNEQVTRDLTTEQVKELLNPLENQPVRIDYFASLDRKKYSIEIIPTEFFRQTVFEIPLPVPGIYGVEIRHFNRKTSDDLFRYLRYFKDKSTINGLIIDLRGNPGGPPLAAREISSFFLPGAEDFAFFQKKGQPKALLDVPTLPAEYKYDGPMVILIDQKSGSASELFSGILQRRKRAVLMGRNSAGQVMLKSMFHFKDNSMVVLITSRGYHPDGATFSFQGLTPDRFVSEEEQDEILKYAVSYILYANRKDGAN